jgi:hypothetical protein
MRMAVTLIFMRCFPLYFSLLNQLRLFVLVQHGDCSEAYDHINLEVKCQSCLACAPFFFLGTGGEIPY